MLSGSTGPIGAGCRRRTPNPQGSGGSMDESSNIDGGEEY
jgi:hypothetical protein